MAETLPTHQPPDFEAAVNSLGQHLPVWWQANIPAAALYTLLWAVGRTLDELAWLWETPYLDSVLSKATQNGLERNFAFAWGLTNEQTPPTSEQLRAYIKARVESTGTLASLIATLMVLLTTPANLTGGAILTFPNLTLLDTLKRVSEESPINPSNWVKMPWASTAGKCLAAEAGYTSGTALPNTGGVYWKAAEYVNQTFGAAVRAFAGSTGAFFRLWTCTGTDQSGYAAKCELVELTGHVHKITLEKWKAGVATVLAERTLSLEVSREYFLSAKNGIVMLGEENAGVAKVLVEATDSTYTKGFVGMEVGGATDLINASLEGPALLFPESGVGLPLFEFEPGHAPVAGLFFPVNGEGLKFPVLPQSLPSDNLTGATGETPIGAGEGLVFSQNEFLLVKQNIPKPYALEIEVLNWLTFDRAAFKRAVERYQPAESLPAIIREVTELV